MHLGVIWQPEVAGGNYRALIPLQEMERRGHTVVWPPRRQEGGQRGGRLASCDAVHVYRRWDERTRGAVRDLARIGVGITWDNDDDFTCAPAEHPQYADVGGKAGLALFRQTVEMATVAHRVSVTSEPLRQRYLEAGVAEVDVIPNQLGPNPAVRDKRRHDGIVIGWVAGGEHRADAARIGIREALKAILEAHAEVRVECIGVDLALPERYRHDREVRFGLLAERIAGFDLAIAPLSDIPFNRSRSDVKLKEYAAQGVPWLASPVGPYAGMGEEQGGRTVPDDGWVEAIDELLRRPRVRRRLARKARRWARSQTIEATAVRWEQHFAAAAEVARAGRGKRQIEARARP